MQDELEKEMRPAKDDGKEKLYLITKYIKDVRERRQGMQKSQERRGGSSGKSKDRYEAVDDGNENNSGRKHDQKKNQF